MFDRHRNLIVAATGTGKTVVAALDYRALSSTRGDQPSLLFVAHRREILVQALRTYREVLGDGSFGELFVGGERPTHWKHVFASIQSLDRDTSSTPGNWDVFVIDEFHHADAASYRRLLSRFSSQELLGLTATPERADGVDVRGFFGGRSAYELRLWDALEQDLLCPFHYYGVADNTDLRDIAWVSGTYDTTQLSRLYTGNDARVLLILKALKARVHDIGTMRALGFCVSVDHARFMAKAFSSRGIPSAAILGSTSSDERRIIVEQLKIGELNCIFTVDVFNEGIDIPSIDVVLMLRPTASSTVFIQQLGRGLRRAQDKALLIVLDFVGQHRADFDLAGRFHAMTGQSRRRLKADLEIGFPSLPGGSRIVLDEVARHEVLGSIKRSIAATSKRALARELRAMGAHTNLATFLHETHREIDDIYRSERSWTTIISAASGAPAPDGAEAALLTRLRRLRTIDDLDRISEYTRVARAISAGLDLDRSDSWAAMLVDFLLPREQLPTFDDPTWAKLVRS